MAEGLALKPDGDPDRDRPVGRPAAGGVARLAGARRSTPAATLERAAHLPRRRSGARRQGEGKGRDDPRRAPAARRTSPVAGGLAKDVDAVRRAHGRHRLQRRQDDGAAAAGATSSTRAACGPASSPPARPASSSRAGASRSTRSSPTSSPAPRSRSVLRARRTPTSCWSRGRGASIIPGYSGVTLGLLHGSCPDALILCHQATPRVHRRLSRRRRGCKIPPLSRVREAVRADRLGGASRPR